MAERKKTKSGARLQCVHLWMRNVVGEAANFGLDERMENKNNWKVFLRQKAKRPWRNICANSNDGKEKDMNLPYVSDSFPESMWRAMERVCPDERDTLSLCTCQESVKASRRTKKRTEEGTPAQMCGDSSVLQEMV